MPTYLLDTNVIVDTLRKVPAAVEYVDSHRQRLNQKLSRSDA